MKDVIYKLRLYGLRHFVRFGFHEVIMRLRRLFLHSYSQCGEDIILSKLLRNKRKGFYVDVGAYDPFRFSNTMHFYKRGWTGINIEPDSTQYSGFLASRSKDINLNIGVGSKTGTLTYYCMNPKTLSTFSSLQARSYVRQGFRLVEKTKIPIRTLSAVFRKYVNHIHIDFMSVDVEGFEMDVLKSNDWKTFRPGFICIELSFRDSDPRETRRKRAIIRYMRRIGYEFRTNTILNYIYEDARRSAGTRKQVYV